MSPRSLSEALNELERIEPERPGGFPKMRCNPERRAEDANMRAIELGGTPRNIRATVELELKRNTQ